jgi:transcriptional repressor NrdR
VEHALPVVVKKDGQREPFDRDKILRSLRIACNKRPVATDTLEETAAALERELSERGEKEVPSRMIGERVMARLKGLDGIAYVRFASVYKSFRDIDEFKAEMDELLLSRDDQS